MKYFVIATLLFTTFLFAQSPIPAGAKLEKVFNSGKQLEGPVWKDGVGLLFSDIIPAKIYLLPADGSSVQTYIEKSDSSNGLTIDKNGNLILTQMGKRRVSRQEKNGVITVLASTYLGKKFNSPNDVVVKSDGSIFFTDPDFNIPNNAPVEIVVDGKKVKGVYRLSTKGNLQLLDATFDKPNGICFSPDEKKLYVNESAKGEIYVWDVVNDSTISNKTLFNKVSPYADGMKIDLSGNLYCTGSGGVSIFSPAGQLLDKISTTSISTSENPSNMAWGDADRKTLYITMKTSLLKIRLVATSVESHGSILPNNFKLYQNYPNPFNPSTLISFEVASAGIVRLEIFDTLGKKVSTLLNEIKQPGIYNSEFSIKNLPAGRQGSQFTSGVYYYRLSSGAFSETRKMVIMK